MWWLFFLPGRTLSLVKFETYLGMISCIYCVILLFLPVMCANYWQLSYCSSSVHHCYVIVCIFVNKPNTTLSRKCWLCKAFLSYNKICSYLLRSYVRCFNWHGSILLVYRDKRSHNKMSGLAYVENNNINSNIVVLLMQSDLSLEKIVNVK